MKKLILLTVSVFLAASGFSQEKAIKNYGFWDNWFIQGQIGASYTLSENHERASLGSLITPHVAVSVGKHFSPVGGLRFQVAGWEAKSMRGQTDNIYKFKYIQTNLDAMFNLTNAFSKYQGDRAFNLYGILGIGYVRSFGDYKEGISTRNNIIPRVGLQADFRLNEDLSLNLEATGNLMSDKFNGVVYGRVNDATANVMLGLTYRFNKGGFALVDESDPELISSLNDQINKQRSDLDLKNKQLAQCRNEVERLSARPVVVEEVKGETEVLMNAVVVFRLGSAKLEQNQDINIYNAAKYLQNNPKVKITVTGYADRATGTPAINQRLSEQRAKAVADILVNKYGIERSRITVAADGDKEQPFQIDAWNRVVVFTAHN